MNARESSPLVMLHKARKCYGPITALDELSLQVERGEILAVLGPNGAGKTTAVELMTGLKKPDRGWVQVMDTDPRQRTVRQRMGVMLQVAGVPETLKVKEHIAMFCGYYPNPLAVDEVLAKCGLEEQANQAYDKLSGGQQRRLQFGLAICGQPDLVFLDEPTTGLDVEGRRQLWREIRALVDAGTGVVLTTHYLEEADHLADRMIVIDKGQTVAMGTPDDIKRHASGKVVRCRTSLKQEQLATLPGIAKVSRDGTQVELLTADAESTVRALLNQDENLTDLIVTGAQLEDAFIHLTQSKEAS